MKSQWETVLRFLSACNDSYFLRLIHPEIVHEEIQPDSVLEGRRLFTLVKTAQFQCRGYEKMLLPFRAN